MLSRPTLVLGCATLSLMTFAGAAMADPGPDINAGKCQTGSSQYVCIGVGTPERPGGSSGGGGGSGNDQQTGSNSNAPICTYKPLNPQPDAGSALWEGHEPGDGAVYERICQAGPDGGGTTVGVVWAATPPGPAAVDPAVLAQQALDKMLLRAPEIGITPKPGGKGVVGMPVYMWTEKGPETYGPNTASASAGGITVTATAKVSKIVWTMGDGNTVTCTTAGTPYSPEYGKKPSPDCGHRYAVPSSTTGSGMFHVTATSTWTIGWQATTGQSGQFTETRSSAVDITVAEVQVLN